MIRRAGAIAPRYGECTALAGAGMLVSTVNPQGVDIRAIEPLRVGGRIVGTLSVGLHLNESFIRALSQEVARSLRSCRDPARRWLRVPHSSPAWTPRP